MKARVDVININEASIDSLMRLKNFVFVVIAFSLMSFPAFANELLPPEHYADKGACPFEGCTYRKWTVTTKTAFYKKPDVNSGILFEADKGETVNGLTGIVITLVPGQAKTINPITLGETKKISLKAGDVVYVLNYVGEGYYKFWFNGQIAIDQIDLPTSGNGSDKVYNPEGIFDPRTVKEPKTMWWVKVKNAKGQIGWAIAEGNFDHMDAYE